MNLLDTEKYLNVVCALACEAKPLIDLLQLRKIAGTRYRMYEGEIDGRPLKLLVTGVGAANMESAVDWLAEQQAGCINAWLNLGIAGHKTIPRGQLVLVHCASEEGSGRRHYPPLVINHSGSSCALTTYPRPCTDYPDAALVDMEGAAFFAAAGRYSAAELVQSFKVVSDNQTTVTSDLSAQLISNLVFPHAPAVRQYALRLFDLIPQVDPVNDSALGMDHLHLTVSHRHQVGQLYRKLRALNAVDDELLAHLSRASSANQALGLLRDRLNSHIPVLS